jgi:ubiquinone/menaquinone biosynthesis C-methylase UbiE
VEAPAVAPGVPPDYYERISEVDERAWWYASSREIERALLGARLRPGLRLLDAGCGPGGHLCWAAASGLFRSVAGVDLARQAVELAKERVPIADVRVAPLHELPFADGAFDLVTLHDVLQHVPESELEASLRELRRVLDPGGALVVRTNGGRAYRRDRADWRLYSKAALRHELERNGFTCDRLTYANVVPSLYAAARGRVPRAPTEHQSGIPGGDTGAWRARVAGALTGLEARYLATPGRSLPYGHTLWAVALPEPAPSGSASSLGLPAT